MVPAIREVATRAEGRQADEPASRRGRRGIPRIGSPGDPADRRHPGIRRIGSAGRLAGFHALILLVVLGAVVVALVRNFTASYETVAANSLVAEARSFATAADARPAGEGLRSFTIAYLGVHALPAGDLIAVSVLGSGRVETAGAGPVTRSSLVAPLLGTPPPATVLRPVSIAGKPFELLATPITTAGKTVGIFVAASDLSASVSERSKVLTLSIVEGLIALVAGVASTFLLLRRLLGTVGKITVAAEAIGSGRLERRLGDDGRTDEVGELARTFDAMQGRIDTSMTAQRRLLSDVSHQLRTPLTVARGYLEVLQRTGTDQPGRVEETVEVVIDELDHMRTLVERLLLLGRAMEPDFLAPELIEVRSLLTDVHEASAVLAERRFELAPVPDLVIEADPGKLRGALLNLLDNAVRVTGPGDTIRISVVYPGSSPGGAGAGELELVVEDSGPGIPAEQREAVLRRFARPGARDSDGSGLGLAIVKAVAETHGGRVALGQSSLGGARVAIVLPARRILGSAGR